MTTMRLIRLALVPATLMLLAVPVQAGLLQDWRFDDPSDTELTAVTNAVPGGVGWSHDIHQSVTTGDGAFQIHRSGGEQGDSWADIPDITAGAFSLIVDIREWNLVFDPTEEFRLGFTHNEGSQITAQMTLDRVGNDEYELSGQAFLSGDGATSISAQTIAGLSDAQSDPVALRLDYDATANTYEIFYKVGSMSTDPTAWSTIGAGNTSTVRDGNFIRLSVLGVWDSTSAEFMDIDRIYLIPEPSAFAFMGFGLLLFYFRMRRFRTSP